MSASQSNLNDPKYGYDFVVSMTQNSLNKRIGSYFYNNVFETTKLYYVKGPDGKPQATLYDDLPIDPFTINSWSEHLPPTSIFHPNLLMKYLK